VQVTADDAAVAALAADDRAAAVRAAEAVGALDYSSSNHRWPPAGASTMRRMFYLLALSGERLF